ncbi:MAG: hypothetical protein ACK6DM_16275 [Alphaproteobacteria bacterium]
MKRHALMTAAFLAATLAGVSQVLAFGVEPGENNLGSEHEKITRSALKDLGPETLRQLAGSADFAGAVGFPDRDATGLAARPEAHCEGGDHVEGLAGATRTRQAAQDALEACRTFIRVNLEKAVELSGALASPAEPDAALDCRFGSETQSAKCQVLFHLGLALHATQDFYANSNWVDRPGKGPVSLDNPPGLDQSGPAPWLDLRRNEPIPEGLVTACAPNRALLGLALGCDDDVLAEVAGSGRIHPRSLSKATGPIGRGTGGIGTTPRGAINGNFSRAVKAAVADTADKWAYFGERVVAVHGPDAAARILCALRRDDFDPQACDEQQRVAQVCRARAARPDRMIPLEGIFEPAIDPSPAELEEAARQLPRLKTFCQIEEADVTRFFANDGGTPDEGKAAAERAARESLGFWGVCRSALKDHLGPFTQDLRAKPDSRDKFLGLYAGCILDAALRQGQP